MFLPIHSFISWLINLCRNKIKKNKGKKKEKKSLARLYGYADALDKALKPRKHVVCFMHYVMAHFLCEKRHWFLWSKVVIIILIWKSKIINYVFISLVEAGPRCLCLGWPCIPKRLLENILIHEPIYHDWFVHWLKRKTLFYMLIAHESMYFELKFIPC